MTKNARPGERPQATLQRTGGDYPPKGTLLPSVVNSWRTGFVLSPGVYVRQSEWALSEPRSPRLDPPAPKPPPVRR